MLWKSSLTFYLKVFYSNVAIQKVMVNTLSITNFCQRNESNFVDLISYFFKMGINMDILIEFIKSKQDLQKHLREKDNQKYASSLSKSK